LQNAWTLQWLKIKQESHPGLGGFSVFWLLLVVLLFPDRHVAFPNPNEVLKDENRNNNDDKSEGGKDRCHGWLILNILAQPLDKAIGQFSKMRFEF
jgi:hypothetical protein